MLLILFYYRLAGNAVDNCFDNDEESDIKILSVVSLAENETSSVPKPPGRKPANKIAPIGLRPWETDTNKSNKTTPNYRTPFKESKCSQCKKIYHSSTDLRRHVQETHGKQLPASSTNEMSTSNSNEAFQIFRCCGCKDFSCNSDEELFRHQVKSHGRYGQDLQNCECNDCFKIFEIPKHWDVKLVQCPFCEHVFVPASAIISKQANEDDFPSKDKILSLPENHQSMGEIKIGDNEYRIRNIQLSVEVDPIPTSGVSSKKRVPIKEENEEFVIRKMKCQICQKIFGSEKRLKSHQTGHLETMRLYCEFCEISCNSKDELEEHEKTMGHLSNLANAPVRLPVPTKKIKLENEDDYEDSQLMKSEVIVNGRTRFQCCKCSRRLSDRQQFVNHMEHHERPEDEQLRCNFCNDVFGNNGALTKHRASHVQSNSDLNGR